MIEKTFITDIQTEVLNGLIGLWDGDIVEIDNNAQLIYVNLRPLHGSTTEIMGEIAFDKVAPEERKYIQEGAIFQLQQYKTSTSTGDSYQTHIVFSREVWTEEMLEKVREAAKELADKLEALTE